MKIKALTELLSKPKDLGSKDTPDLTKLTTQYPFFQIPHIMLAKSLHNTDNIRKDDKIFEAALYAPSRSKLHDYIIDSFVADNIASEEKVIQKTEIDTPKQEIIKDLEIDAVIEIKEIPEGDEQIAAKDQIVDKVVISDVEDKQQESDVDNTQEKTVSVENSVEEKLVTKELKETEIGDDVEAEIEDSIVEEVIQEIEDKEKTQNVKIPEVEVPEKAVDDNKEELLNVMEVISAPEEEEIELLDWSVEDDEKLSLTEKEEDNDNEVIEGLYYPSADYLASLDISGGDKSEKKDVIQDESEKTVHDSKLIEDFLKSEPRIVPKPDFDDSKEDLAENSIKEDSEIVTESLAKIYMQQKLYGKAINIYEKLSLKYPKKSAYFASQIDKINKLM